MQEIVTQSNITYLVAILDKLFQMIVNGAILLITALAFHWHLMAL